jgi:hypothetical protein
MYLRVGTGNLFIESTLQHAEELGRKYRGIPYNSYTQKTMALYKIIDDWA